MNRIIKLNLFEFVILAALGILCASAALSTDIWFFKIAGYLLSMTIGYIGSKLADEGKRK